MQEAWHLFQIRRTLLTSQKLGFTMGGVPNSDLHLPDLQKSTAAILYVNATSLLDEATAARMTIDHFKRCGCLANRLVWLNKRHMLLDFVALNHIRERRNDISHKAGTDPTLAELDDTCSVINRQFVSWGLIVDAPSYELYFERTGMLELTLPTRRYEHDRIVRVMQGDDIVYELKRTISFLPAGQQV